MDQIQRIQSNLLNTSMALIGQNVGTAFCVGAAREKEMKMMMKTRALSTRTRPRVHQFQIKTGQMNHLSRAYKPHILISLLIIEILKGNLV